MSDLKSGEKRVIIIGLDAADYHLCKKFMDSGEMPRLFAVRSKGNFSRLQSVVPPNTPPGWTSITTGVNPGKHGIFYFYNFSTVPITVVNSTDTTTPRIWDYVGATGGTSVSVNVPVTYPAAEIRGCMVAGIPPWFFDERSVQPPDLIERLTDYQIDTPLSRELEQHPDELVNSLMETERRRIEVFLQLLGRDRDWRFGMIVMTALDRLQHKLVGKGAIEDAAIKRAYHEIDLLVGKILDEYSDCNFLVVSDHGFNYTPVAFYPNSWLYRHGYVKRKSSARYRATKELHDLMDGKFLWMPKFMTKRFQGAATQVRSIDAVDTEKSKAFVPGTDGLVIVRSSSETEAISSGLSGLVDESGNKVCTVYRKEQVYAGDKIGAAPALLIVPRTDVNIRSDPFSQEVVTRNGDFPRGNHGPDGIFFGAGPDISPAGELVLKLEDVCPTALTLLGIARPEFMDGRVVSEILGQKESRGEKVKPAPILEQSRPFRFSQTEEDLVMENLRRLGYT